MESSSKRRQPPIAIVGIGGLFPGSIDVAQFWSHVLKGTDLITDVPSTHWSVEHYYDKDQKAPDKTYAQRGGFLPEVSFDSLGFGIPPSLLSSTDTSQLLGLLVARTALEDCFSGKLDEADKSRVSVLLGVTSGQELFGQMASRLSYPNWRAGMLAAGIDEKTADEAVKKISDTMVPWTESTFPGLLGNVVAGRIANRLDLGGTNAVTDAACASSFAAVSMGIDELVLGRADVVLTGGVDTLNDIFMHMCFSKTPALSERGDCRPFDEKADGTLLGEGLGMLAMKRLEDAERDGNHIYAVIKGVGTSSDGRSKSVYAPVPEGQATALRRAYDAAGYGPETVELVEAHGTGTKAGDIAELTGLKIAFNESGRDDLQWCALGSVKSQIGHTKAAAGAAGLLKAALALHHRALPPTIKVDTPNPRAELEKSPFYVNTRARPWVRSAAHPRRASVSSFGFGGSNFHITLEEYQGPARASRLHSRDVELFCFSAADVAALQSALSSMVPRAAAKDASLGALAQESHEAFDARAKERVAFVASSLSDLSKKLGDAQAALSSGARKAPGLAFGSGALDGKVAFVFPGQGSQSVEMGAALALSFPEALSAFDEADGVALAEAPLSRVVFPRPAFSDEDRRAQSERLTKTEWAQPALGATSVAFLRVLEGALGLSPDMVAGHSFGELTALYAAGVFDYPTLLTLARRRGELMAEAAKIPGGMLAVTGPVDRVREALAASGVADVVLANHNAPDQAVLSGAQGSLALVDEKMKAAGLKTRALQVATGFHSPLVAPAAAGLSRFLDDVPFADGRVPVFANTSAAVYPAQADEQKRVLAEQVRSEVRFVDEIRAMHDAGARVFVEVGPGRVLTGLVGRILADLPHSAVNLDGSGGGLAPFFEGLAKLLAAGVPLKLSALFDGVSLHTPGTRPSSSAKKPALAVPVTGSNLGKPAFPAPRPPAPRAEQAPAPAAAPARHARPSVAPVVPSVPQPASRPALEQPMASREPPFAPLASSPAPAATPTSHAAPRAPAVDDGWLTVFREGQQQTAEAHSAFQRSMADAHQAFLRAFEASTQQLTSLVAGEPVVQPRVNGAPVDVAAPVRNGAVVVNGSNGTSPHAPVLPAPMPVAPVAAAASVAAVAPVTAVAPVAAVDAAALLLEVAAEKTGYPKDALSLEMSLEADLGIDSIKRVEILGSLRERMPGAPEVDPLEMAQLSTLGEVAAYLQRSVAPAGAGAPPRGPEPKAPIAAAPQTSSSSTGDLTGLLLDVVAEKTGYPKEALALEMSLEADLGVDSIKRVEILGSLRERAPHLPEVDAMQLAQLSTLGEIAGALATTPAPASAPLSTSSPAPSASGAEVASVFLDVVADKTGYPKEALALEMGLESDLGIDSIKRVEILGAVRERLPGLPEVDAMQLAQLSTLGEIVSALSQTAPGAVAALPAARSAAAPSHGGAAPASGAEVASVFLDVVADKTGYPKEALALEMGLESDLGIDSIKRVEILGAVRERLPGLPEVDAMQLAQLSTLGEIVSALSHADAAATNGASPSGENDALASAEGKHGGVVRATVALAPLTSRLPALSLHARRVVVVSDGTELGTNVVDELVARGAHAALLDDSLDLDGVAGVIDLSGLAAVADDEAALGVLRRSFDVARRAARALQANAPSALYCVVQDLGGSFGLTSAPSERALLGGLAALAKTAAQEWSGVRCKALDVERGQHASREIARVIVDEALGGADAVEVGARGAERVTVVTRAAQLPEGAPIALGERPVILATGGARGVTATSLEALAERVPGLCLVLLGRTDVESLLASPEALLTEESALKQALFASAKARGETVTPAEIGARAARILAAHEVKAQLARFAERGAKVLYLPVDVRDTEALHRGLDEARRTFGPLTGVVHGAGVLADKRLEDKTLEQLDLVMDTKVRGLLALLEATAQDPLRFIALFSSVAGRFGNVGQADYAMANEALNKVALRERARRGSACVVKSYAWGPWEGGMVTPALQKLFEARGVALLPLADGARFFVDELSSGAPGDDVEVVFGGPLTGAPAEAVDPRPSLSPTDEEGWSTRVDSQSFAFLRDHSLRGVPVLPVVVAMDLIARAAERRHPGMRVRRIHELRVLRGVPLSGFSNGGNELRVRLAEEAPNGSGAPVRVRAEVYVDQGAAPRYRALVDLGEALEHAPAAPHAPSSLAKFPADRVGIYRDLLFHGPSFHLVDVVEGVSKDGIVGRVSGTRQSGWDDGSFRVDAGALDAGLQLALLYGRHILEGAFLPTGFERFTTYVADLPAGPLRCVVHCHADGGRDRVRADLTFVDDDGRVCMAMMGVELHRLLDPDAFSRLDSREAASAAS